MRGNKNVGRMAIKRARQHLGQKIGSYKDLFGAELHHLEELNGQMPQFEKDALKSIENLVKDLSTLKEVKNGNFCLKMAAFAITEAFWLLRMFHHIGNSAP